jgi:hypothetical protein
MGAVVLVKGAQTGKPKKTIPSVLTTRKDQARILLD